MMELLSPAGSFEALQAAVCAGADAVYLGATAFSARASAANFDEAAMPRAISYAHLAGVKVLVTVNTLIFPREMDDAIALALRLRDAGGEAGVRPVRKPGLRSHELLRTGPAGPKAAGRIPDSAAGGISCVAGGGISEAKHCHAVSPGETGDSGQESLDGDVPGPGQCSAEQRDRM